MSVVSFKITEEKMPLNHSPEKEKNIRHIHHDSSSYSLKKIQVGIHLLLVELCERFTFFEVVCNMIPFCTAKLGYHNSQAAILNLCFIRTSIITSVFVGWFADVCVGRKKLVYMCLLLHFLGTTLLSVVAFPLGDFCIGSHHMINNIPKKETRLLCVALLAICCSTGGIRAIVCPLDSLLCNGILTAGFRPNERLRDTDDFPTTCKSDDWDRFYWIMNLSAIVVFLGISYIQHSGAWALVLLIPFMSTLMALITLHMVHYNLMYQPEKCFSLLTTFGVFVNALRMYCLQLLHGDLTSWLDHAKEKNGGHYSELHGEDTKFFFTLYPLFTFQLLYKICIMQIPSGHYLQTMNSNLNLDGFLLPIAVMNVINTLPLLVLAPRMEYLRTCLLPAKRDGSFLLACIISGNLSAALSVMVAGFFEIHRKHFPPVEQPLPGKVLTISSMPCLYLVLQYALLGVAETLVHPVLSIISYRFAPSTVTGNLTNFFNPAQWIWLLHGGTAGGIAMLSDKVRARKVEIQGIHLPGRGCGMGVGLITITGTLVLGTGLFFALSQTNMRNVQNTAQGNWFPNTLNKGNLESFFFFLASLPLLNALGFWSISQRYCILNHFNAQNISGSNLEETLLLREKSLKFYGSMQEFSSSIDLWGTAL